MARTQSILCCGGSASDGVPESVTYTDGVGNVLMEKVLAEPGLAPERDENGELEFDNGDLVYADTSPHPRWVGTGRTILDNKGNPIKQYEPFFSDRPDWETEAELVHFGVTPILHYDPLGRLVRTDHPDGTLERVVFTPWHTEAWDANDTVLESAWYAERDALGSAPAAKTGLGLRRVRCADEQPTSRRKRRMGEDDWAECGAVAEVQASSPW